MPPFIPSLFLILLLAGPALLTPTTSHELQVRGHRTPRDTKQDAIKVVISEGCANQGDSSDVSQGGKEIDLVPGSPLVLTHKIKLVPSGSGSGSGSCGCEADFAALRERLERLEREVSTLREKCGGAEGGCCTSKESKGAGCSIKPDISECPNECSDQGRCVDGKCVCFPGFSGADCSESDCPGNCNDKGRCVNGQCVCDPGFTGPDCSDVTCPNNCNNRGRCVNGKCVCESGFTGTDCSEKSCPGNCNNKGRCVNGQCVCNPGFTGPDCSKRACPDNCNSRGRCVNGKCVCNSGFTGADCSEVACPGNCNNKGRCVNGQCVCNPGFTGPDCSQRSCPDNCNNRGRCVNGKCVCNSGFTGADCSEVACPGNCNNRGRCINGECVCDEGFGGPDCSERICPNDCYDRGKCVDGQCVCDSGFTGDDCSEKSCPGNCNNKGRCVDGQCVCDDGFTGADCSEKSCPNNCSNRGKCVNGKCVCNVGFAGPDCSAKGCPNNCSNKGRCVKGKCVCRRGFTGPDCSQCDEGMTGPNCDIVMSGVTQLNTQDITETSVTLVWTPPTVQYDTYHITFTSQKESDQQITAQVEGSLTTFTQTGLAAGQEYSVTLTGEIDGRRGTETSTEFMTLISGPTNLRVVKTTTTSAVVQWEKSHGEIDRYHLTITPSDGAGRSEEMTVPPDQDSAHIQRLEAGRTYDIILVAEKGSSRSEPATTKAVPGKSIPRVTMASLTRHVTPAPGLDQEFNPSPKVQNQQGRREDERETGSVKPGVDGPNRDSASVIARTKPLVNRKMAINGTRPKLAERPALSGKPKFPGPFRFNTTRVVPGGRKVGHGPLKKPQVGEKKKVPVVLKKPKPGAPKIGNRTIASTVNEPSVEASSTEGRDDKNPAITSGTDSEANRQSSLEEPKEQPDVGMDGQGKDTDPVSSEPSGAFQSQEKKCLNKIKVTHIRLPLTDRGGGCRGDGTVVGTDGAPPSDLKALSEETDVDITQDPLYKLVKDTFHNMNITTFSVHLSKESGLPPDADTKRVLTGLRPLSSFSSSSASSSPSQSSDSTQPPPPSSSSSQLSADQSHSSSPQSSSSSMSLPSHSHVSSSLTEAPSSSLTDLTSSSGGPQLPSLSLTPSSHPSASSSSSDESNSVGNNDLDADNIKSSADTASPEQRLQPNSGKSNVPVYRRTSPKHSFIRRPHSNADLLKNKTNLNFRVSHRHPLPLDIIPGGETEPRHAPTDQSLSSSASEESSSIEVNTPVRGTSGGKDVEATPAPSEEQNQKKVSSERKRIPIRRPFPNGGYVRRPLPNKGPLQNRTRPNSRIFTRPPQPLHPEIETQKERTHPTSTVFTRPPQPLHPEIETQKERTHPTSTVFTRPPQPLHPEIETQKDPISPTDLPVTSSPPVSKESDPAEGTDPVKKDIEDRSRISVSNELNKTLSGGGSGVPSSKRPNTQAGFFRRTQLYGGPFQNRTRPNLRPPLQPHRHLIRKPHPGRKPNERVSLRQNGSTPGVPEKPSGEQDVPRPTQEVRIREAEEQETEEIIPSGQTEGHGTTTRPEINDLEKENSAPVNTGKDTAPTIRGKPAIKPSSSNLKPSRPVTPPRRQPPKLVMTGQNRTQPRKYISGSPKRVEPKTNVTTKTVFESEPPVGSDVSSSGVTREPLDYVGVTNKTSDGFTVVWDSPEGKYKNFVVTKKQVRKPERPKQEERQQEERQDVNKKKEPTREPESGGNIEDENRVPERVVTQTSRAQSSTTVTPALESDKTSKEVLPGSARSIRFEDLPPQTEYVITLLGKGPGLLSRLHKLVISTGPEPPTNIIFSELTENSLTVSWTKPKSPVSGFKVTYTHTEEGEPVSVSLDSKESSLSLSQLSPGSTYEVNVISILGLDESDPIKDSAMTLPDPPTDLRAVNVTDTKALLLWRPALAAIDKYAIVYGSGTDSEVRITVSGNAAEQQLSGLKESTTYTVTITSQLGSQQSSPATTTFTTTSGSGKDGDGPRDLQAHDVTPRTALLTWKPPPKPAGSYKLIYETEGQGRKEVIVDASVTEYNLTRLHPGSKYTVELQVEGEGQHSTISTEFTTGTLRFPFPSDCSQEMLNGIKTSGVAEIYPRGKQGKPLRVYCDMETDGGGWTVFQRRKDGSVNFFRGWRDYIRGFGDLSGEFWLGLDSLHNLTTMTRMNLRVDLQDGSESVYAKYSTFEVANRNYKLTVGGYSGTAGDSLTYHNNRIFSTKDRDLAPFITRCAMSYRGGWWYKNCHEANLNGLYGIDVKHQGVIWTSWKGKEHSIAFTEMKMRPASFSPPVRG